MRGVKYIAPLRDQSGYGEASRNYVLSLHNKGVPLTTETRSFEVNPPPVGTLEERNILAFLEGREIDYDIVIVHLTPDLLVQYAPKYTDKYLISYTVWETNKLHPIWVSSCKLADEIWVPCFWNQKVFENSGIEKPILRIPHGINPNIFEGDYPFSVPGIDKNQTFVFYSIFQWNNRKNPEGLLRSYFNTFSSEEKVALVLKTYMGRGLPVEKERDILRDCVSRLKRDLNLPSYPKLYVISSSLSGDNMKGLHNYGDSYVTASRGEGWGLGAFEAGLAGNPVIAPNYGAFQDYLLTDNSFLVDCRETYVSHMSDFNPWYLGDQVWGEPDLLHLSSQMREVFSDRVEARARACKLQSKIKEEFSWNSVSDLMFKRLEEI